MESINKALKCQDLGKGKGNQHSLLCIVYTLFFNTLLVYKNIIRKLQEYYADRLIVCTYLGRISRGITLARATRDVRMFEARACVVIFRVCPTDTRNACRVGIRRPGSVTVPTWALGLTVGHARSTASRKGTGGAGSLASGVGGDRAWNEWRPGGARQNGVCGTRGFVIGS